MLNKFRARHYKEDWLKVAKLKVDSRTIFSKTYFEHKNLLKTGSKLIFCTTFTS